MDLYRDRPSLNGTKTLEVKSSLNMDVPVALRVAISLMLAGLVSGCNRGVIYHPTSLPPDFIAPQTTSMNRVDLSRLSQSLGDSEMLYPGDVVSITISTGLEKDKPTEWRDRIADDGTVNIPLIGIVPIAGLRLPFAERLIHDESINRGKFVNPTVTVLIAARRSNLVTVVGEVNKPGTYQLPASNSNVLAAITAAEGLTKDADTVIEVRHAMNEADMAGNTALPQTPGAATELAGFRRDQMPPSATGPRAVRIDLAQNTPMHPTSFQVADGSTVMIMKRPKRYVHVIGLVRKPDQFEMPEDQEMRLLDAIAKANGRTLEIADKVRVIRNVPNRVEPIVIEASIGDAKQNSASNIRLAPGDVVSVEETATTMVVGTIRDFVRFGFTSGIPGL
jgi:polysaccharide biosynthesis/export protein